LTKQEFLTKISEKHADLSKKQVADLVGDVFEMISTSLQAGEKVAWAGFGTFSVTERAARKGRNPQTGEELQIKASKSVKFKVSGTMKDKL